MEKKKLLYRIKNILIIALILAVTGICNAVDTMDYTDLVSKAESAVEEHNSGSKASQYKALVQANEAMHNSKQSKAEIQALLDAAKASFKEHSKNIKTGSNTLLRQVVQNSKNLESASKDQGAEGIIIFVSFSMPKEMLWSYSEQAKQYGARLVMRGLVENSFKQTVSAMSIGKDRYLKLDINPNLFKEYGISKVPSIAVIGSKDVAKGADTFTGSVSLKYGLEISRDNGDQKEFAAKLLKTQESGNAK